MALDVYFAEDVRRGLAGALSLTIETAAANGPPNADYLRGVLALARAQCLAYGLRWADVVGEVRAATKGGELGPLLQAVIE